MGDVDPGAMKARLQSAHYQSTPYTTQVMKQGKSAANLRRLTSALTPGYPEAFISTKQQVTKDVYMLDSQELVTSDELFGGLAKIGMEFGRSASMQNNVRIHM